MPTCTPVMVLGEEVWPVVRATLVREAQAMLPVPDDEPERDDEPDDDPGTLYFGREDGWTARSQRHYDIASSCTA